MADEIYVINVGGYIGSSTRSEIEYAVAMIVSFFMPIATLIIILVMVAAMTVGIFRMMHADKK